jgi:5-methylcytosine-specific restriction protein A
MPQAAPRPCTQPGCSVLVHDGTSRCSAHKVASAFADKARGTRHQRGYGTAWDKLRAEVLQRDHGICQPHLREGNVHQGTHVDHRVEKADGGTDDKANLQCVCAPWHRAKTARHAAQARKRCM